MQDAFLKLYVKAQTLFQAIKNEEGQDLIEYALLAGIISLAAAALMPGIGSSISTVFTKIGNNLSTAAGS